MTKPTRIRTDYKTPGDFRPRRRPNLHWRLRWTAFAVGFAVLGVVMAKSQEPATGATATDTLRGQARAALAQEELPLPATEDPPATAGVPERPTAMSHRRTVEVESGDTFARLLQDEGVADHAIHAIVSSGEAGRGMARIHPGDTLRLGFDESERLTRLEYRKSPERRIVFERGDDGFEGRIVEEPLQRRLEYAHGVIESSLFRTAADAGLDKQLTMRLVSIFAWDIDFALDIRRGDRFTLVYEGFYRNGDRVRTGDVVAAEFVNRGEAYRALRYTTPDGETDYYAPDGRSMRKAFLRTPVEFTRISSRFGSRYHPTLHRMRDHHGVDYAAPTGTPVRATGDGRIARRDYAGGYGRMIVIRHGRRFSTAYAHMSRYASGSAVGRRVEQGDIIGYVGSSGRSTGPHLHYEFRVNGQHRNPLTVEFPSVEPVAEAHEADFREAVAPLIARLDTLGRAYAARGDRAR